MPFSNIDKPSKYFSGATYLGSASAVTVSSLSFQPDFVWIKDRQNSNDHCLVDSVRGVGKYLGSNLTSAEVNSTTQSISSFTSTGFVTGTANPANESGSASLGFMSWNWLASNSTASNTSGSITSTVSANTTSGFSIVTYTSNGTSGATVGHGLGVAPSMIIMKNRSWDTNWFVYHKSTGNTGELRINATSAFVTDSTMLNNTTPSSSVITLGNNYNTNYGSGYTYVAYCFAEVKGYSKFGSYVGNGSSDGTFIYTGFKPSFVLTKSSSNGGASYNWQMWDNKRNTYNAVDTQLRPNKTEIDNTDVSYSMDFVSNGFKMRGTNTNQNGSGSTYIYMAFAENPFCSSKGIPCTAR